ncbi:hypothetical protein CASFOL_034661 [Castilleja foliolosa]|uniref:FAF domain-containing protein n=1 Tax=Castilleja foliolosa TaxID=1961234 RepID=A0ABD3BRL4_9LAMI
MYKSEIGDRIGSESCGNIDSDVNAPPPHNRRRCRRTEAAERDYPPPIPWLARTENRPSHMPFVMKRHYSGDGRLVITEERVSHHEYFQVYRTDDRVVLNIVPLRVADEEEESEDLGITDGGDEGPSDPTVGCYAYNNTCGGFSAAFRPPLHT